MERLSNIGKLTGVEKLSDRWMYYSGLLACMGVPVDDMKHIQNLIDAEEQGLLLRLPCKVGEKVFYIQKCLAPSCKECKGFLRVDNCYCEYKSRIFEQEFGYRHLQAFGNSVFLTKEEAEQALEKMKEV